MEDTQEPQEPRTQWSHQFDTITLEAGKEHNGWCQSWILNNEEELWVNAVELVTGGGYHHSNWFFVPEGELDYPPGLWKNCYNKGFHEIDAAVAGGVLFAQSTQVDTERQEFPAGVAVRIPPYSRIIGATHLLNVMPEPLETELHMHLWTIEADAVSVPLTPFRLSYLDLDIPAQSKADFTGECEIRTSYEAIAGEPYDMELYWVLPHYHSRGDGFELTHLGGDKDGESIFEVGEFSTEPFGVVFDPPISLSGSDGLRFTCRYDNELEKPIHWGIGIHEMCVMLGFARSKLAFDISVLETDVSEAPAQPTEAIQNSGPCVVFGFPFDQEKAGGQPTESE